MISNVTDAILNILGFFIHFHVSGGHILGIAVGIGAAGLFIVTSMLFILRQRIWYA